MEIQYIFEFQKNIFFYKYSFLEIGRLEEARACSKVKLTNENHIIVFNYTFNQSIMYHTII